MDTFIQQILNGLVLGSMYALVALGYTMVYGVLNLINFAHGDVLMIGAMIGLSILNLLGVYAPDLPGYVQLGIAIIGAIPACMLVNIRAAPCAADYGDRRFLPAADLRNDDLGPQSTAIPATAADRTHHGGRRGDHGNPGAAAGAGRHFDVWPGNAG
jgi:hypothetical protein